MAAAILGTHIDETIDDVYPELKKQEGYERLNSIVDKIKSKLDTNEDA